MKLHLNATLRAALIAAISTVGFSLTQAQADTTQYIQTFGKDGTTKPAWANDCLILTTGPGSGQSYALGETGVSLTMNISGGRIWTNRVSTSTTDSWNANAIADMNTTLGTELTGTSLNGLCTAASGAGGSTNSYVLGGSGFNAGDTITIYVGVAGTNTDTGDYKLTGNYNVSGLESGYTVQYATDTGDGFSDTAAWTDSYQGALTIVKITGTIQNPASISFGSSDNSHKVGANFIAFHAEEAAPVTVYTWAGTEGSHDWNDAVWNEGASFVADADATFDATAESGLVSVSTAVSARNVTVGGKEYTFDITGEGSLTAKTLSVETGASLSITGGKTMTVSGTLSIADAKSLTVAEGSTLKVTGESAAKSVLSGDGVDNKGTTEVGADITIDGSLTSKLGGTVKVADGKKLTLGTTKDSHTIDLTSLDALVLGQGANIDTKAFKATINNLTANNSTLKMLDTKDKGTDGVILQGTTTLAGNLTITSDWKYRINIAKLEGTGSLELTGGNEEHRAVIGDASIHSLNVTNKMNEVWLNGTVTLGGTLNVNGTTHVTGGNTLTVGGLTGSAAMDVANGITFTAAEGTYSYTGTLTVGGKVTKQGAGSQTIGGYAMHQAIDVQAGTLVLNGSYAIDNLEGGDIRTTYVGGQTDGNGFSSLSGTTTVYTVTEGANINTDNATFTVGGSAVDVVGGIYTAAGDVNYDTYYVNSGTESLGHAIDYAAEQGHTVSTVAMSGTSTITMDREGASVGLTLAEGATGTVDTTVDTALTGVSGAGALVKTGDATLTLGTANTAFTGDVTISGGTVKIGNNKALGEHNEGKSQTKVITIAEGGTLDLNGVADANFKYTMSGGTLTNTGNALGYGSSQTTGLDLTANSTVHADNGHDLRLLARNYNPTALNLNNKTLTKTGTGLFALKNTTVSAGTIEVQGGEVNFQEGTTAANITLKGGTISGTMNARADITIDAQETTETAANLDMDGYDLIVTVAEGKELTLNGSITNGVCYTKDGDGTLNLGGLELTQGSFEVNEGIVNLDSATKTGSGVYTLLGEGTLKLGLSGIDLQAGTLNMSGAYDISDVMVIGDTYYDGGIVDGNGFAVVDGTASVVTIEDGAELFTTGATFKWNDQVVTVESDGSAAVNGKNYGAFYIFTESETVTTAKSMEAEHGALSAIYVEEGATLTVDQDINGSLVSEWSSGTVSINEGKTVTGAMEGVALAGAGTYDLGSTASLGTGTTLGQDWTGVVRLSNLTKGDGNSAWISSLANGESWVEFVNFTGYDRAWASSFVPAVTANIILTSDGTNPAWNLSAFASSTNTMVLSGKVKGDGTFLTAGGSNKQSQAVEFQGDISEWTGAFVADAPGMRQVVFTGDATQVNAAITKQGEGALNLVVGNGTDEFETVFNAAVTASAITVKANATATFNELHITSAINNSGTVAFSSDLEVTGFTETAGADGYYDEYSGFTTNGNGFAAKSDSYITIVNGGEVAANIKVTQGETDYTLENSGNAYKGDGSVTYGTYYVNTDTVCTSELGGEHTPEAIVVNSGGTLDVDMEFYGTITVKGDATLQGDALDVTQVGIASGKTATFATGGQGFTPEDSGVTFIPDGSDVEIKNIGDEEITYSIGEENAKVTAGSLMSEASGDSVTIGNALVVKSIHHEGTADLTLAHVDAEPLQGVYAHDGVLSLQNITEVSLVEMEITSGSTVAVYTSENADVEGTVTVTETLAAGNGTLLANLKMADDSALLLEGVQKGVSIGSTLTMNTGIQLDEATLRALDGMAIGNTFWLIGAVDGKPMEYTGQSGEDAWYDAVFSRTAYGEGEYTLEGDFNIAFSETDGFGLKKFSNTPEPATGTLSLLALAALAARRRKH